MKKAEKTFTARNLSGLPPGWYCDPTTPGFLLRVYDDGRRFFGCRYRVRATGRRRYVSLGEAGILVTFTQARNRAKELLAEAALHRDPCPREKNVTWDSWVQTCRSRLTTKRPEFFDRYLGLTAETPKRGTGTTDDTFRKIRAKWAPRPVAEIGVEDVENARAVVREGGLTRANRFLNYLSAVFGAAVRSGLIARNPCSAVKLDRENPGRQRVLSPDEM
ncbi:MAG: integrase arm-type DNA-binding domain-containing protein, partial [Acidithiobacillales bacterium]